MKTKIIIICMLIVSSVVYSQNFGVGIQSSFYNHGLSAKIKLNDDNAVQAVVSLLGPFSSYTGRYIKGFESNIVGESIKLQPYIVGGISLHTITVPNQTISSSLGYGIGAGIDWSLISFGNFEISNEIAWTNVTTALVGYSWSYIHYGFGVHYYFGY